MNNWIRWIHSRTLDPLDRIWMFGNDLLSSRSVVAADIILFGPSTFTKEL